MPGDWQWVEEGTWCIITPKWIFHLISKACECSWEEGVIQCGMTKSNSNSTNSGGEIEMPVRGRVLAHSLERDTLTPQIRR